MINFLLLAKLAFRYRFVTVLAFISLILLVPYIYSTQPVIYQKEVFFKIYSDKRMSDLLQEVTAAQTMPEVLAVVNTYDFTTRLSEHLVKSSNFKDLNLEHPKVRNGSMMTSLRKCKESQCRVKIVRNLVPNLFSITSESLTGRFSLKITTRSSFTTLEILRCFQKTLEDIRLESATELAKKQLKQMQDMADKSKAEIESKDGFEKVASSDFLDALIAQNKNKIITLSNSLIQDDNRYYAQSVQLKESNLASESLIEVQEKLSYENYTKINKKIEDLRQNIASINSTPFGSRTQTDETVLSELKKELLLNEEEIKRIGHVKRNLTLDDSFINTQKGNKSALEFDHRVSSAKVKKLKAQYETAKSELDALYVRKAALETELVALKPDLEYLKLLESKLVAIKFKQSSITSDVFFEQYGTDVLSFKTSSLWQIAIFSFLIIGFLTSIIYLVIYMIDDRIFDELEIQKCIDDLPIIGQAPYFE